jgi:hypothetical protein
MCEAIPSLPLYTFMAWCLVKKSTGTSLPFTLGKQCGMVWIGCIWIRTGTSGGTLWTRNWTFGFRKRWGISWLAEWLINFSRWTRHHGVGWLVSYLAKITFLTKCLWNSLNHLFRFRNCIVVKTNKFSIQSKLEPLLLSCTQTSSKTFLRRALLYKSTSDSHLDSLSVSHSSRLQARCSFNKTLS